MHKFLCKIGLHNWKRETDYEMVMEEFADGRFSRIYSYLPKQTKCYCANCGMIKEI